MEKSNVFQIAFLLWKVNYGNKNNINGTMKAKWENAGKSKIF